MKSMMNMKQQKCMKLYEHLNKMHLPDNQENMLKFQSLFEICYFQRMSMSKLVHRNRLKDSTTFKYITKISNNYHCTHYYLYQATVCILE